MKTEAITTTDQIRAEREATTVSLEPATRGEWVPVGRALHVVDLENLVGIEPRFATDSHFAAAAANYQDVAQIGPGDHLIIGVNPARAISARLAMPRGKLVVGFGPDGADHALLGAVTATEVAQRYDRLVIGSGDGVFADLAAEVARRGVRVEVVSRASALASRLRMASGSRIALVPEVVEPGEADLVRHLSAMGTIR